VLASRLEILAKGVASSRSALILDATLFYLIRGEFMLYVVKWTESGMKRSITVQLHATAVAILNALLLNCNCWNAKIVHKRGF
jgi:hypothetical protein